jgi:hypothetical protein
MYTSSVDNYTNHHRIADQMNTFPQVLTISNNQIHIFSMTSPADVRGNRVNHFYLNPDATWSNHTKITLVSESYWFGASADNKGNIYLARRIGAFKGGDHSHMDIDLLKYDGTSWTLPRLVTLSEPGW